MNFDDLLKEVQQQSEQVQAQEKEAKDMESVYHSFHDVTDEKNDQAAQQNMQAEMMELFGSTSEDQKKPKTLMEKIKERWSIMVERSKLTARVWVNDKIDKFIDRTTQNIESKVKSQVIESHMPGPVKEFVEETFEYVWTNSKELLKDETRTLLLPDSFPIKYRLKHSGFILFKPYYMFRNWFRYKLVPFDRGFWTRIRDPWWIGMMVLFYTPYYCIQNFMYLLLLLLIDRSETYQLVHFILSYKNTQFFTTGCLNIFYGYLTYFYCADLLTHVVYNQDKYVMHKHVEQHKNTYSAIATQIQLDNCYKHGPDSSVDISFDFFGYISQVVLIWVAYSRLRHSKPLIEMTERNNDESDSDDSDKEFLEKRKVYRGGRLRSFLVYDIWVFLFFLMVFVVLFFCTYYDYKGLRRFDYNRLSGLMFFTRSMYGLFSLPFVLFIFQIFITLFTHARPTGYDRDGNLMFLEGSGGVKVKYRDTSVDIVLSQIARTAKRTDY